MSERYSLRAWTSQQAHEQMGQSTPTQASTPTVRRDRSPYFCRSSCMTSGRTNGTLTGQIMNSIHQCGHSRAISVVYSREFQAQSAAGLGTPHDGLSPDLPFLDKK